MNFGIEIHARPLTETFNKKMNTPFYKLEQPNFEVWKKKSEV